MDVNITREAMEQIDQYSRDRIGRSTLERYTGSSIKDFQPYVLLTNFNAYVDTFSEISGRPVMEGSAMRCCHCPSRRISIIDYSMGSPMAALVTELLSFVNPIPRAVLMLGMCGGLKKQYRVGDFFNPVAAIREEGTSNAYMPPQVPSLSSFAIQRFVVDTLEQRRLTYHTGVIHTTNVRFWEFNEEFKKMLESERVQAIDMECATLFTVGFARYVPMGALMLISDLPFKRDGIKTAKSAQAVFKKYTTLHLEAGMGVLMDMQRQEDPGLTYQF